MQTFVKGVIWGAAMVKVKAGFVFPALLTSASVLFAVWNALDEYYMLQSIWHVTLAVSLWSVFPIALWIAYARSRRTFGKFATIVLALCICALYCYYALNGSTQERDGAQHLHIFLVPPYLLLVFGCLALLAVVLRRHEPGRK